MNHRRLFLALPVVLCSVIRPHPANAQSTVLQESDPEAGALAYKADAATVDRVKNPKFQPGQACATCSLFVPEAGSPTGGCQLILGKDVAAIGWCNAWEAAAK